MGVWLHFDEPDRMLQHLLARGERQDSCLLWTGTVRKDGCGIKSIGGQQWLIHRLIWTIFHGDAKGFAILHHCKNSRCFEITHLYRGTPADVREVRHINHVGEKNPRAKLTEQAVRDIYTKAHAGEKTTVLAEAYHVSSAAISQIKSGCQWKHLRLGETHDC